LVVEFGQVVGVLDEPGGLDNFERIDGGGQDGGDEWVWIEGDGCEEFFEVRLAELRWRGWRGRR